MKILPIIRISLLILLVCTGLHAQQALSFSETFENPATQVQKTGRGFCAIENGVLKSKDASASFGDQSWTDYELKFSARTPVTESQVQIWFGFREFDRNNRYPNLPRMKTLGSLVSGVRSE